MYRYIRSDSIEAVSNKPKSLREAKQKIDKGIESLGLSTKYVTHIDDNHNCIAVLDTETSRVQYRAFLKTEQGTDKQYRYESIDPSEAHKYKKVYIRVRKDVDSEVQKPNIDTVYEILQDMKENSE